MYRVPPYIVAAAIDEASIRFVWDDTRASQDFTYPPERWLNRWRGLSDAAQIALGIGQCQCVVVGPADRAALGPETSCDRLRDRLLVE